MRVAIFTLLMEDHSISDLEKRINCFIELLEKKYSSFEIIDMLQSGDGYNLTISIWYKVMKG